MASIDKTEKMRIPGYQDVQFLHNFRNYIDDVFE